MAASYDKAVADEIIARIAEGEPLRQILRSDPGRFPRKSAWYNWCEADPELDRRFKAARDEGFDALAEETLEIADDARNDWIEKLGEDGKPIGYQLNGEHVQRSKLRIDTRLKLLAKWDPRRYGDKMALEHSGSIQTLSDEEVEARYAALMAKAGAANVGDDADGG